MGHYNKHTTKQQHNKTTKTALSSGFVKTYNYFSSSSSNSKSNGVGVDLAAITPN